MLGVSVGVNVQELLAAEPADQLQSGQAKIGFESIKGNSTQFKENSMQQKLDATQQKLPSRQDKDRGMPGMKPMIPSR